jgi:hypothetical protein
MASLLGYISDTELYYEVTSTDSARNLLTGDGHLVTGSDNLIAGAFGTLSGDRTVLMSLDGSAHDVARTGALELWGDFYYNGSLFTPSGAGELDDLSDVTLTSPASGEVLTYNGSAWVNEDFSAFLDALGT